MKIAIVGAGPAGTHMAYLLHKNGYKNITVFEKDNRIGGKSYSIMHDNVMHEMGTCYLGAAYVRIRSLMEDLGITEVAEVTPELRHAFVNGKIIKTQKYVPEMMLQHWQKTQPSKIMNAMAMVQNIAEKIPLLGKPFAFIADGVRKYSMLQDLIASIRDYMHVLDEMGESSEYDIPNMHYQKYSHEFAMSMSDFLEKRGWPVMNPIFTLLYTTMCYGYNHTSPSYYGIYWLCKQYVQTYLNFIMHRPAHNNSVMLKGGFQNLWETMVKEAQTQIIYEAQIKQINRSEAGIEIEYNDKKEKFDFLISAIAAPDMLKLLSNPSADEQTVFSNLIHSVVVTKLIEVESEYTKTGVIYWLERLCEEKQDMVFAMRTAASILQNRYSGSQTAITYQYYDDSKTFDEQKSNEGFNQGFENTGIKVKNIIASQVWKYLYRFTPDGIKAGLPWKIKRMQGCNNTIYIGSSVCFESVNAVVNYNHYIMDFILNNMG